MEKECYYRRIVIAGEDVLSAVTHLHNGWNFKDRDKLLSENQVMLKNTELGVVIIFNKKNDNIMSSVNVLPLDSSNINNPDYNKGFDSSVNQMEDIHDDILFNLCCRINDVIEENNFNILCGITPSEYDKKICLQD